MGGLLIGSSLAAPVGRNVGVTLTASNLDTYNLDVDQNGTTDFTFETAYVPDPLLTVGFDQIRFAFGGNNGVVIDSQTGDGFPPTSRLLTGNTVSSASLFSTSNDDADLYYNDSIDPITGNFGGTTGYVGFRFDGLDGIHYGYVQVTVASINATSPLDLTIGNVVYDTTVNAPAIVGVTPEPASLGLIAVIGLGLGMRNRRRN